LRYDRRTFFAFTFALVCAGCANRANVCVDQNDIACLSKRVRTLRSGTATYVTLGAAIGFAAGLGIGFVTGTDPLTFAIIGAVGGGAVAFAERYVAILKAEGDLAKARQRLRRDVSTDAVAFSELNSTISQRFEAYNATLESVSERLALLEVESASAATPTPAMFNTLETLEDDVTSISMKVVELRRTVKDFVVVISDTLEAYKLSTTRTDSGDDPVIDENLAEIEQEESRARALFFRANRIEDEAERELGDIVNRISR